MYRMRALTTILSQTMKVTADNHVRTLYSAQSLGIDMFLTTRERIKIQINNVDNFKGKMEEFVKDENQKNLIFTEDLKNMLHISEQSDIPLLKQMIEKFCSQNKEVRFGNFVFGPVVLRLFHHLNASDTALELFKDKNLGGFFDQLVSYQLLLDMLFNDKKYQAVLDTYNLIRERQVQGARFPKHVFVLTLAACYKLNTPESFEYATKLWQEAKDSGHIPMRRGVTFFAALAINQGKPHIALEVVATIRQQSYLTIRTIKALALTKLNRFDDVIPILKSVLEVDNPMAGKQTFPGGAIDQLKKDFEANNDKNLQADFDKVIGFIEKHGHKTEASLDDVLCAEIQQTQQINSGGDRYGNNNNRDDFRRNDRDDGFRRDDRRGGNRGGYQRDGYQQRDNYGNQAFRRPGLHELN